MDNKDYTRFVALDSLSRDLSQQADRPMPMNDLADLMEESKVWWHFESVTVNGVNRVLATRDVEIESEIKDKLNFSEYSQSGERFVGINQLGKVAMITNSPLDSGSAAAIFAFERDLDNLPKSEASKRSLEQRLIMSEPQAEVVKYAYKSITGIAKKLNIKSGAVSSRLGTIFKNNDVDMMGLLTLGYLHNDIDMTEVSDATIETLSASQKEYMAGQGIYEKSNTRMWLSINEALGSKHKNESLLIAIRAGLIATDK